VKQRIYIETTIASYLVSRPSGDVRVAASQVTTIDWWEQRREAFDLFVSEFVLAEASLGDPPLADRRMEILRGIPELEATDEVRALGDALLVDGPIPTKARIDAYHIAVAAVHGIDFLLTWNCAHIANAAMRSDIEAVCRDYGFEPPVICTPQELMEELR